MLVLSSSGEQYLIPNGIEVEVLGGQRETLVIKNGAGDRIAFFNVENIDGWGDEREIEKIDSNAN